VNGTRSDRWLAAAAYAAIIGGLILLIAEFVALPAPLIVIGLSLFLASVVAAVALAVETSRREGIGFARAVARGLGLGVRWIFAFLP
jgi:hypothetical protein